MTKPLRIWVMYFGEPLKLIIKTKWSKNKANLRDLTAATGLVILLKLHPNLFNNTSNLCALFRSHWWIKTWVKELKKYSNRGISWQFLVHLTLKFDDLPWKTIWHPFYATLSFVHPFMTIGKFNTELQSGNAQFGKNQQFFYKCDLEIWQMTSKKH